MWCRGFGLNQGGIILHCFESVLVQNIGSEVAGTPPLQVNYLFHTSLRLFRLGIYALFILVLTWEGELRSSQAAPKDLVTWGKKTEQSSDRPRQIEREWGGGETVKSEKRQRPSVEGKKVPEGKMFLKRRETRGRGKRGQEEGERVTWSAVEVKVWAEAISFRFRDAFWQLTDCHSVLGS